MRLDKALASAETAKKPPRLRDAEGVKRCQNCRYFKAKGVSGQGACRLYGSYPVRADQVSDAFRPR